MYPVSLTRRQAAVQRGQKQHSFRLPQALPGRINMPAGIILWPDDKHTQYENRLQCQQRPGAEQVCLKQTCFTHRTEVDNTGW